VLLFLATGFAVTYRWNFFEERAYARDFISLPVTCPAQSPAIAPLYPFEPVDTDYSSKAAARLSGAIRIRTETFDTGSSNGNGQMSFYLNSFKLFIQFIRSFV
jgi:hypothetical protein